jgi:hypothetical protein
MAFVAFVAFAKEDSSSNNSFESVDLTNLVVYTFLNLLINPLKLCNFLVTNCSIF